MSRPRNVTDLRSDLHGHVMAYATDLDRSWFTEHPDADCYDRPALKHELCDPRCVPECRPVAEPPEVPRLCWAEPWMHVTQLAPGLRARGLFWAIIAGPHGVSGRDL